MTDHVAEARRLADMAGVTYGAIETRNGDMAVAQQIEAQTLAVTAQVYATLALVEQQRVANLIALKGTGTFDRRGHLFDEVPSIDFEGRYRFKPDIARALGLEATDE